jgi:hypothetical protein
LDIEHTICYIKRYLPYAYHSEAKQESRHESKGQRMPTRKANDISPL